MKKIGVATLGYAKENYGQLLQAYALQAFLKKSGYNPFLIKYRRKFTLNDEKGIRKIAKTIYIFLQKLNPKKNDSNNSNKDALDPNSQIAIRRSNFDDFYKTNFKFSDLFYSSIEQLRDNAPEADIYIAGSDQIWNWGGRYGYDEVYFLQFGKKSAKRIVYAAGMSKMPYSSAAIKELNKYLSNLDHVSLREPTGIPLLKKANCQNPQVVLDPSLLLDKSDYLKMTESIEIPSSEYVLGYFINFETEEDINWYSIENYLSTKHIDFKYISSEGYYNAVEQLGKYENQYYTVEEWIAAFQHTKYVLTSSYHGLLFSIIMNKPFLFFFIDNSKHSYGKNRALHILEQLGLETRVYDKNSSLSFKEQLEAPIDWLLVNKKHDTLKKSSIEFLINAIENS